MATLQDSWNAYLKSLGHSGQFNDMLHSELKNQTSSEGNLADLWQRFFLAQSITGGTFNDKLLSYLASLGYTSGTINDRLKRSLVAQDFFPTEGG